MKTLYLLRHAKSSWDNPALSDRDRPLNARGEREAPRMGEALGTRLSPMRFHVSPAERAQQTFHALCAAWPGLELLHGITTPALYTFDYRQVLDWVSACGVEDDTLALVGHNPAFTELVCYLVKPDALDNLPTAGWVEIGLPIDRWQDIHSARYEGELLYRLFPKMLGIET